MKLLNNHATSRELLSEMIQLAGGEVRENRFVIRPGVMLIVTSQVSDKAKQLMSLLSVDTRHPDYLLVGEFNGKLTYLSTKEVDTLDYNRKMARVYQHLSVYGPMTATFWIGGISLETSMELVAHKEATVGRLTSSKTKAMNQPLYRVFGPDADKQIQLINAVSKVREEFMQGHGHSSEQTEWLNLNNIGSKATTLTYTMALKDFHKLFIGRLPEAGNETEVREVCTRMCQILHEEYPIVIRSPEEYRKMGNGEKYESE